VKKLPRDAKKQMPFQGWGCKLCLASQMRLQKVTIAGADDR
jgi:hypothetical protein